MIQLFSYIRLYSPTISQYHEPFFLFPTHIPDRVQYRSTFWRLNCSIVLSVFVLLSYTIQKKITPSGIGRFKHTQQFDDLMVLWALCSETGRTIISKKQSEPFSSFMTRHRICNKNSTTTATCGAGIAYPSRAPEFTSVFSGCVLLDLQLFTV